MPNELIVGAIQPMTGSAEKPADLKAEPFVAPQAASPAESGQLYVNPTLRFDSTLGLLVIEFRDTSGNVSTSIPSQRQLEAYRLHEQPLPGQKQPAPSTATAAQPARASDAPGAAHVALASQASTVTPAAVPPSGKT